MSTKILNFIILSILSYTSLNSQILGHYPHIDTLFTGGGCTGTVISASIHQGPNYIDTIKITPGFNTSFWYHEMVYNEMVYLDNIYFLIKDSLIQFAIELWYNPCDTSIVHAMSIPFDSSFVIESGQYYLALHLLKGSNAFDVQAQFCLSEGGYGIGQKYTNIKNDYHLYSNYPNPFNPTTTISFSMPRAGYTTLTLHDVVGREVAVLVSENLNPGTYSVEWNASNVASGVYFYRLQSGFYIESKKLIVIK